MRSEIADLDAFAHFFKAGGKVGDKVHFDAEIDRQIRVLVRRIDRAADEEIDVRRLFEQKPGNLRRAVVLVALLNVGLVVGKVILCILQDFVDRDHALGHKVDPLDVRNGRNVRVAAFQFHAQRLS